MRTIDYLESVRTQTTRQSWYAVAKALNTTDGVIANIRKGKQHPSIEMCFRIAAILEIDPSEVITTVEFEAAKSEEKKEFWKGFFFRYGKAAMIATAAVITAFSDQEARAGLTGGIKNHDHKRPLCEVYIQIGSAFHDIRPLQSHPNVVRHGP